MVTRGKALGDVPPVQLAYIAGVVDSDGHIGIDRSGTNPQRRVNPRYEASITIVNTHLGMLEWIQAIAGGSIRQRKQLLEHHKPTYQLKISERQAAELCRFIACYLIVKQKQALLLIDLKDNQVGQEKVFQGALPRSEVERRERIWREFKALNDDRRPQRLSERAPRPGEAIV